MTKTPSKFWNAKDPLRAGVVVIPGYKQTPSYRIGLGPMHRRVEFTFYDQREIKTWMSVWNGDHATTAQRLSDLGVERIFAAGYSYGCGHGLIKLAEALAQQSLSIELAFMVDPVTRFAVRKWRSMFRLQDYVLPGNIDEVHYWRQVNGSPFGRIPRHPDGKPVTCYGVYGSRRNLEKHADPEIEPEASTWRVNSSATHSTIDNDVSIHNHILHHLRDRIGHVG